jgi:hypothetical protein
MNIDGFVNENQENSLKGNMGHSNSIFSAERDVEDAHVLRQSNIFHAIKLLIF